MKLSGIPAGMALAAAMLTRALSGQQTGNGDSPAAINAIREYQLRLGLKPTGNFRRHSGEAVAAHRCYYAPLLELPASYEELRFETGSGSECPIDGSKYDVFSYAMEAVASGDAPVTEALAEAAPERRLMVVLHEDFHQQHEKSRLPAAATEAASTLLGFISAAGFASGLPDPDRLAAERLSEEAGLFLAKSQIVNRYHEQVSALYRQARRKKLTEAAALEQKRRLFAALEEACRGLPAVPVSFDSCPGALNNAGLAFDYTYTKHYPLLHGLFEASGKDLPATVVSLRRILNRPLRTEKEFVKAVEKRTRQMRARPGDQG